MKRRTVLIGAGAAAVAGVGLAAWTRSRTRPPPQRPAGVPLGAFDAHSTAEEVTAGLDLGGRTALVTGCTSGLGLETMRVLAMRGAHVLGTGRTVEKARDACAAVAGRTTPLGLELADLDSVVACAESVRELGVPIDVLVCNAGIMALPRLEQVDGIEKQFFVNHLGHFLLVNRLLPEVKAAPQGRVVVLSSLGYRWAPETGIEFDNLAGTRNYQPNRMYGQSKLANGLFSRELARRLEGTTATSNSVHPGVINTNLGRHFEAWKRAAASVIGWTFMKSIEEGAATTCYVATNPRLAKVRGYYFEDCNPVIPGGHMEDDALAAKLWNVSTELVRRHLA